MFLLAQEKSDTIEFLKSELVQLLSNMRQEIAASRQSQTGAACHHIEHGPSDLIRSRPGCFSFKCFEGASPIGSRYYFHRDHYTKKNQKIAI